MQGHALRPLEGLTDVAPASLRPAERFEARVRALRERGVALRAERDGLEREARRTEAAIASLEEEERVLLKVRELFRVLTDRLVMDQVRGLSAVVTEGLKTIFFDQDLAFDAELGQRYNKVSVEFYLRSGELDRGGFRGPPLEAFGGGPSSVVSLVLRVLTLLRLNRAPLLLLDETLAAVSDDYIEPTAIFLKKLAASAGIDVLLVTHKPAFLDHADAAYQGDAEAREGATSAFVVRKVRGPS